MTWTVNSFRVERRDAAFGVHFLTGGLLIQEEAAMTAVEALNLKPGERVLDLCAAPGNKTVQLAHAVGSQGWVVANDVSSTRLQVLRAAADRFGLANLSICVHDGTSFPERILSDGRPLLFDAVLADVPCSCEGTCRKHPDVLDASNAVRARSLPGLQVSLLRKAIRLTRPGGRIMYSTCTFSPAENEAVIDAILKDPEKGQEVILEPIHLPELVTSAGLDRWNEIRFSDDMHRCVRLWPHQNDTGGFFLALLRKAGDSILEPWPSAELDAVDPATLPWSAHDFSTDWLRGHGLLSSGNKANRWVASPSPDLPLNVLSVGTAGLNLKSSTPRFSSSLALHAAPHAHSGLAHLARNQILPFLQREPIEQPDLTPPSARTRIVLVLSGDIPLGIGRVAENGQLHSHFPTHAAGLPVHDWLSKLKA